MIAWWWIKRYDLHKLLAKLGGVGGSFVASHLVVLTTTQEYREWWERLYMTAPVITNVPAFERLVTAWFALIWIAGEHIWTRFTITSQNKPAVNPPRGDTQ